MSWSKIISAIAVSIFVLTIATISCAVAGEKQKQKAHGANFSDNWKQLEVGDEEGHVIATYTAKQIYFEEITGEKHVSSNVGFMDINTKTGIGFLKGYGTSTFKGGDKIFRSFEGKPVGKGHWKGTYVYIKGTGKYKGIQGSGTWDSYSLAPMQSYVEAEGEFELP